MVFMGAFIFCIVLLYVVVMLALIFLRFDKIISKIDRASFYAPKILETNCLLDKLCKKVVRLNNNLAPNNPDAWFGFENQSRAAELREKNPETFEMVSELLKMYLGYDDKKGG